MWNDQIATIFYKCFRMPYAPHPHLTISAIRNDTSVESNCGGPIDYSVTVRLDDQCVFRVEGR